MLYHCSMRYRNQLYYRNQLHYCNQVYAVHINALLSFALSIPAGAHPTVISQTVPSAAPAAYHLANSS